MDGNSAAPSPAKPPAWGNAGAGVAVLRCDASFWAACHAHVFGHGHERACALNKQAQQTNLTPDMSHDGLIFIPGRCLPWMMDKPLGPTFCLASAPLQSL
jgi:hypothetical protein